MRAKHAKLQPAAITPSYVAITVRSTALTAVIAGSTAAAAEAISMSAGSSHTDSGGKVGWKLGSSVVDSPGIIIIVYVLKS